MHIGEERVTAQVETKTRLVAAEIHHTLDALPGDSKTRKWITKQAVISQNSITSDLPPTNTTIWFLTVKDDRDTVVSSELVFPTGKD